MIIKGKQQDINSRHACKRSDLHHKETKNNIHCIDLFFCKSMFSPRRLYKAIRADWLIHSRF